MKINMHMLHIDVSKNRGTLKSSILIGFSSINNPFWGTPIFVNPLFTYIWLISMVNVNIPYMDAMGYTMNSYDQSIPFAPENQHAYASYVHSSYLTLLCLYLHLFCFLNHDLPILIV